MYEYNDYLIHHGVKGMKWGVRKDYRPTSIRSALARRSNAKVDNVAAMMDAYIAYKLNKEAFE